jgi:hypothetical protein
MPSNDDDAKAINEIKRFFFATSSRFSSCLRRRRKKIFILRLISLQMREALNEKKERVSEQERERDAAKYKAAWDSFLPRILDALR